VNVFRHDYVSYDYEPVTAADSFEDFQEQITARGFAE
jgi:hypothetical protein